MGLLYLNCYIDTYIHLLQNLFTFYNYIYKKNYQALYDSNSL
jgi:hypothetical protein